MSRHTNRQLALLAAVEAVSTYETEPFVLPDKVLPVADRFFAWLEGADTPQPAPVLDDGLRCEEPLCVYHGELVIKNHQHEPRIGQASLTALMNGKQVVQCNDCALRTGSPSAWIDHVERTGHYGTVHDGP